MNGPIPQQDAARLAAIADELLDGLDYGVTAFLTIEQVMEVCNVSWIEAAWVWGFCRAGDAQRIAWAALWN